MSTTKSVLREPKTIDVVKKEVLDYIKSGRTPAFGGGSKLAHDTVDKAATLTGNYENISYTNQKGEDKVLTLCEFKCGSTIDTTSVDPQDKRLVIGTKVKISVKEVNGIMRNTMKFA